MPGMLKREAQIGRSNRGLYAAISADQAANLAPPGISISISHFQLSKEEKQPKGRKLVGFSYQRKAEEKKKVDQNALFSTTHLLN